MAKKTTVEVDGRRLSLTNLDKIFYAKAGFSKADLIHYYVQIAPYLLPHLHDRAITMKRYPDGVDGEYFYETYIEPGTEKPGNGIVHWDYCDQNTNSHGKITRT